MTNFIGTYKITTYIPAEYAQGYIEKISADIPKMFGEYDHVLWWSDPILEPGTEQFRPLDGSNPIEGDIGEIIQKPSVKIEFSIPKDDKILKNIIENSLKKHHPWNKPVIYVEKVDIVDF